MAVDATQKVVPGHGTLFIADRGTAFPANPLTAFTLTGAPPSGWTNIGHTSKDNTAAFTRSGGDATTLDSWIADAIATIYASTQFGLKVNPIQLDGNALNLAFNGFFDPADGGYVIPGSNSGLTKQIVLLATDGSNSLIFWAENTSINLGDAPSFDPKKFVEVPLAAQILAADPTKIPAAPDGRPGIIKVYKSGLTAAAPVISAVTPNTGSGSSGTLLTITGSGFTGATGAGGVKFGSTNAGTTNYTVINDTTISAKVPSGLTAGSQPVTVTTPSGTSNAVPFTAS